MGKNQKRLMLFALRYPGWHGYGKDRATVEAVEKLCDHGFIEINDYRQFQLRQPGD